MLLALPNLDGWGGVALFFFCLFAAGVPEIDYSEVECRSRGYETLVPSPAPCLPPCHLGTQKRPEFEASLCYI